MNKIGTYIYIRGIICQFSFDNIADNFFKKFKFEIRDYNTVLYCILY